MPSKQHLSLKIFVSKTLQCINSIYNLKKNVIQHSYSNFTEDNIAQYIFNPNAYVNNMYNEQGKK